ncbi:MULTISPECIES: GDP-mannose 4,6-dehydratase [Glycomyces]|uniref:GDP-mannose 4,6-dehydratase n=2 Tax=Glycomyces TaxID=58113 RepID=A0A9X3PM80_9ACTN|nr:GDP-mannose 4,6-dehydratase [Glycomyces lechevalierae]MDA1387820.1 GDP-mannose 4,6-dehydratase [Glycomyces lechevalierae]MDR7337453.1 UDP-glucose 4-epimerase [Glycomyces lechevalierae]
MSANTESGAAAPGKAMVTGGAGFIGSHVALRLAEAGWRVGVVDDLSAGAQAHFDALAAAGVRDLFVADVSGPEAADLLSRWRPDVVVHLAAQSKVSTSVASPAAGAVANVVGTVNLLEAAVAAGAAKFVAASSGGAAYGSLPPGAGSHSERSARLPLSPYGASKAAADLYLEMYAETYGISCTSLLLGNVYGDRLDRRYSSDVIAHSIGRIRAGERPRIYGDGTQTRDFVHVSDVVEAFKTACETDAAGSFNIGTGVETSVNEVVAMVCAVMGAPHEVEYAPELPAEVRRVRLDIAAAERVLGWRPKVDLESGIRGMRERLGSETA